MSSDCCFSRFAWLLPASSSTNKDILQVDTTPVVQAAVPDSPYEAYYRVWYNKGLITKFIPQSIQRESKPAKVAASPEAQPQQPPAESTAQADDAKEHWSNQMSIQVEPQSQGMHGYWEKRSTTTTLPQTVVQ